MPDLAVLLERASGPSPAPLDMAAVHRRARVHRRRRRGVRSGLALLVVVGVAAAVLVALASPGGDPHDVATELTTGPLIDPVPTEPRLAPGWHELPAAPLSPRTDAVVVWTGREVVVVGGTEASPCVPGDRSCSWASEPYPDGAAYTPATGRWRRIAPVPDGLVLSADSALPGSGTAVVGGRVYAYAVPIPVTDDLSVGIEAPRLLCYDPEGDEWSEVDLPGGVEGALVAHGSELVLAPMTQRSEADRDVVYDPASGRVTELPRDPLHPSFGRIVRSVGGRLVLIARPSVGHADIPVDAAPEPEPWRVAELVDGAWRTLGGHQDGGLTEDADHWTVVDDLVVNATPGFSNLSLYTEAGREVPLGAIFDTGAGEWHDLPQPRPAPPVGGDATLWPYRRAEVAGRVVLPGRVFDVATRAWSPFTLPEGAPTRGGAMVGAGDRLVTWGGTVGAGPGARAIARGWMWVPPDR